MNDEGPLSAPYDHQAKVIYQATCKYHDFIEERVSRVLKGLVHHTPLDEAVMGTWHRMHLNVWSITKLDAAGHFQAVASLARTLYELLIDIKLLRKFPGDVDKYHDFVYINRIDMVRKYINALDEYPAVEPPADPTHLRTLLDNPKVKARCQELRDKHWNGNKRIEHWYETRFPERIKKLAVPAECVRHRNIYSKLCWHVHAGSSAIAGQSADQISIGFVLGHAVAQDAYIEATMIVCEMNHMFQADPKLKSDLSDAWVNANITMLSNLAPEVVQKHFEKDPAKW